MSHTLCAHVECCTVTLMSHTLGVHAECCTVTLMSHTLSIWSKYLVQVSVLEQLVLILEGVLQQGPDDEFQLRVVRQQPSAQPLQPQVRHPVHCHPHTPCVIRHHSSLRSLGLVIPLKPY